MALALPAIRGKMGSIEFYQVKMRARELVSSARPASEIEGWDDLSIEERIQRELNKRRVREDIVPYLAQAPDRFFGSILVLIQEAETFIFEPLGEVVKAVMAAYKPVIADIGVLTIDGGQMVVLDGQHRLAALRAVIQGEDDKGKSITGKYVGQVPNDELVVVFVQLDTKTTRRVFNKINKNAKTTTRSDNIITSEDDGYAIIARRLLNSDMPLGLSVTETSTLVNWKTNTLSSKDPELTTISAVYTTVKDILTSKNIHFDEKRDVVQPDDTAIDEAVDIVALWWATVLEEMRSFGRLLDDKRGLGFLRGLDADFELGLLLRPAAHIVLLRGLVKAVDRGVDLVDAARLADKLDWSLGADLWSIVLVQASGRITARAENYDASSELVAYMISADKMTTEQRNNVESRIARTKGMLPSHEVSPDEEYTEDVYTLPTPLVPIP